MCTAIAPKERLITDGKTVTLRFPHNGIGTRQVAYEITKGKHDFSEGKLNATSAWGRILLNATHIGQKVTLPEAENNEVIATIICVE